MAAPRRPGVLIPATSQPTVPDTGWREAMANRLARSASRLDVGIERQAACSGMDTDRFYPWPGNAAAVDDAKSVCRACPVMRECLMQALRTGDEYGVLGATTPDERRQIRRRLARSRAVQGAAA